MHARKLTRIVILLALFWASQATAQTPQDKAADKAPDEPSFERVLIDEAIKNLKVFAAGGTAPARARVVMRWPNSVRGTTDGATVILTSHGRPVAACCVYTWEGNELHLAIGSLSTKPVSAEVDGQAAWHPQLPGVAYRLLPNAPPPASSAAARLRQMREISRRFSSRYYENETKYEELRLVPKPVYRYELDQPDADPGLVDGAVFAFAQGTDPESLLLIEARREANGEPRWLYATAKRTVGQINIGLDGKEVTVHKWGGWSTFEPDAIFTTLRRPIKRDE